MTTQIQDCPLCGIPSTFSYSSLHDNTVKNVKCPRCKKLVFEEGTEEKLHTCIKSEKDKIAENAKSLTGNMVLYFSWNFSVKNSKGDPQMLITPTDPNCL